MFPFLTSLDHQRLDEDLRDLLDTLESGADHQALSLSVHAVIKSVTGKLVRPGWQQQWHDLRAVPWTWFGDIRRDRTAKALHEVFTAMVRLLMEGANPYLQNRYKLSLRRRL